MLGTDLIGAQISLEQVSAGDRVQVGGFGVVYGDIYIQHTEPAAQPKTPETLYRNPYKALEAFTFDDVDDFFGRETLTNELVQMLIPPEQEQPGDRLLAVVGASGSGKSSIVRAGLIPRLLDGAVPSVRWWEIVRITPKEHPCEELATQLRAVGDLKAIIPRHLMHELESQDGRGLHRLVESALAGREHNARCLVFVDQFEELYTQTREAGERVQFVSNLLTAASVRNGRTIVVLAVRADFYGRLIETKTLKDWLPRRQVNVGLMTLPELARAIEGPANNVGLAFEPDLVTRILDDVGDEPGALPLLQFALTELVEHRENRMLTKSAYEAMGGVTGSLARRADTTYETLDAEQREVVRDALLRMVTVNEGQEGTRRRVPLSELTSVSQAEPLVEKVLTPLVEHRLMIAGYDKRSGQRVYEISHEALVREWKKLGDWLLDFQLDRRFQQTVSYAVATWLRRGQSEDILYRGKILEDALAWVNRYPANANEAAFIEASQQHALRIDNERRRQRLLFLAGIVTVILVIIVSLIAVLAILSRDNKDLQMEVDAFKVRQTRVAELVPGGVGLVAFGENKSPQDIVATATQSAALNDWKIIVDQEYNTQYGIEMVQVPAGCFWMGSVSGYPDERPVHEVCFDTPFWIDRYEVTNGQFERLGGKAEAESSWSDPNLPRTDVNWFEADEFCKQRAARLPTEAQWEYAARGADSLIFPWGNEFEKDKVVADKEPAEAGSRPDGVSWVGSDDMSGNVWEWTSTIYHPEQFPYPYDGSDGRELSDDISTWRVMRGGSFNNSSDFAFFLRIARRSFRDPGGRNFDLGFRCARLQ